MKMLSKSYFFVLFISFMLSSADGAAQTAMSVDLGTEYIKVGLVKPGIPMETVLTKESRRKIPNMVAFKDGDRFFGDVSAQMSVKFPPYTVSHYLNLLGKPFDHPFVALYKERFPHLKLLPHPERNTVVFEINNVSYTVEAILAMVLWNAQDQANAYAGDQVKNVVISVPSYFNLSERVAVANSSQIAGLNLLSIIDDGVAAALNYGVFRRKELSETPQTLLIYDMGESKTVATLAELKFVDEGGKEPMPTLTILGMGYDRTLGGQLITTYIRDNLLTAFQSKHKTSDITGSPRAMAKLYKEADRVKTVLSANFDHFAQIENLFEEIDFKSKVNRELVNEAVKQFESRLSQPIVDALKYAQINLDSVGQIVLMGAGTRVPAIQQNLQEFIGDKELGRFLNTDEAIALGAVFEAAHLSKGFRVKPFKINAIPLSDNEEIVARLTKEHIDEASAALVVFQRREKSKIEKEASLNALESYVYDVSRKLEDKAFNAFVTEDELNAIRQKTDQLRVWLEDEMTPETEAQILKDKKSELMGEAKKMTYRKRQSEERSKYYKKFDETIQKALGLSLLFSNTSTSNETIFSEDELKKFENVLTDLANWFKEKKESQEKLPINQDPVLTIKEITDKTNTINNEVNAMKSKIYLHQVKLTKLKKEAEEKENARKAEAAAKNKVETDDTTPEVSEEATTGEEPEQKSNDTIDAVPELVSEPTSTTEANSDNEKIEL